MTSEQEKKFQETPFERLQEAYNQVSDTYKRLKPEIDRAREQALKPAVEALDEIWHRAQSGGLEDLEAIYLLPGGRALRIGNIRASNLNSFNFCEFPINFVVSENELSLFKPEDEIKISVTNNRRILISSPQAEKMLIVDFLTDKTDFTVSFMNEGKPEEALTNEEVSGSLHQLLTKDLIEGLSTFTASKPDELKKALAVNEVVQAIYQIADNKLKAPAAS